MSIDFNRTIFHNSSTCNDVQGRLTGQQLPGWLQGIVLYNSPAGIFDYKHKTVNHWMDGLSVMSSFKIEDKGRYISFTKKYLKSDAFQDAMEQGRPIRTEFGTPGEMVDDYSVSRSNAPRRRYGRFHNEGSFSLMKHRSMSRENVRNFEATDNCNCSFYQFGNLIMATNETAYDRIVDPDSLETGDLIDMSHLFKMKSGRPLKDHNGDYFNLAASFVTGNKYHFIRFKKPSNDMTYRRDNFPTEIKFVATIPSRFPHHIGYFHSFGMTDNYLIFCEQPIAYDVNKLKHHRSQGNSFKDCLEWMPGERNHFYIVEKNTGRNIEINYISDRSYFFFNFVNCYEDGDHIVVDMLTYDGPEVLDSMWIERLKSSQDFYKNCSNSRVIRFVLPLVFVDEDMDLNHGQWQEATALRNKDIISIYPKFITQETGMECPKINPFFSYRKYNFTYVVSWIHGLDQRNPYANSITKVDMETGMKSMWRTGDEFEHPSEIIFVPNPSRSSEDEGIIISCVTNSRDHQRGYLVFVNARNMKEMSRAYFDEPIPFGNHTTFIARFI